jgi:enhancing lycopene biosynthesis protein 2
MKNIAVILSGCGNRDAAEIHESVLTLLFLDQLNIPVRCLAPNMVQKQVVDHVTGKMGSETRNVLIESARIARGNIEDIATANPSDYCGMIFPGGYGAGSNLSDFLLQGVNYSVQGDVLKFAQGIVQAKKPGGFICIAPNLIPAIYGKGVKMTIGNDNYYAEQLEKLGCKHINCNATDIVVDEKHKVISTPAYMLAGSISEAAIGIEKLVKKLVTMI